MYTIMILADVSNGNLLLGVVPESLGLLVSGFVLIACAILLRWFFNRYKGDGTDEKLSKETR